MLLVLLSGCNILKHKNQKSIQPDGLNFLNHTNLYTAEKMSIDQFLSLDTIRFIGTINGLHPDSLQSEMEIRFFFDRSELKIYDYVIDSITRHPDPNLPKRVNKKVDFWYCYGSEDYIGKYAYNDSVVSFNVINRRDSIVKIEKINYRISVLRWEDEYDYEVEFVKIDDDNIN